MKIHRIVAGSIGAYLVAAPLYIAAVTPEPLPAAGGLMLFGLMLSGLLGLVGVALEWEA